MDIYLIPDAKETPNFPEEAGLLFLVRFNFDEFKQIDAFFFTKTSFFEDFRLYNLDIEVIYKNIVTSSIYQNSRNKVASILKIEEVCTKAISGKLGVIGFAD
jgi:hypothetical protein